MLERRVVVILFESCQSSAAIVLGTPASLLVTEVLTRVGREQPNMLRVFAAPLHLGLVIWLGESLLLTCELRHRPI